MTFDQSRIGQVVAALETCVLRPTKGTQNRLDRQTSTVHGQRVSSPTLIDCTRLLHPLRGTIPLDGATPAIAKLTASCPSG